MKIIKLWKWYNGQEKNNFPRTVVDSNSNSRAEEGKIYRRTLRDFISDQIYLRNFFAPGRIKNFIANKFECETVIASSIDVVLSFP
jgi:hypothetical protein